MTQTDAHVYELLAGYESLLTATTRALRIAEELAAAHAAGTIPPNLRERVQEIERNAALVRQLAARVSEYKALFQVH